jgi:hypothetical protein
MDYSEQESSLNISTEELKELVQEEVGEQIEVQGRTNDDSDSVSYDVEGKREDLDVRGSCNEDGSEVGIAKRRKVDNEEEEDVEKRARGKRGGKGKKKKESQGQGEDQRDGSQSGGQGGGGWSNGSYPWPDSV